ncbi:MAG: FAD-binding oxidoreductase, partial [Acidimicrobiales bacterium]
MPTGFNRITIAAQVRTPPSGQALVGSAAMSTQFDVAIIGGGIAGATVAAELSRTHSVVLLEQENELAFHTTSRSAAIYIENEGGPVFHRVSTASRPFFEADHLELDAPLLDPLPVLKVGDDSLAAEFRHEAADAGEVTSSIRVIEGPELLELCPVLRPDVVTIGMLEPTAASIDVMALHQLFIRRATANGADNRRAARVVAMHRRGSHWSVTTEAGEVTATTVVNAAGAWGDVVATMAGAQPIGLTPMRRTAFTAPITQDPEAWPFIYSAIEGTHCYFKPEAGQQLLCSLSDETPSDPCDARAEEIDVAQAIDHINTIST